MVWWTPGDGLHKSHISCHYFYLLMVFPSLFNPETSICLLRS